MHGIPVEVLDTAPDHRPEEGLRYRVCTDYDEGGRGVLAWFYSQSTAEQYAQFVRNIHGRPA